jgi:hypothetical protein
MIGGTETEREFSDILQDVLEKQEAAAASVAPSVLWRPSTVELASVRHASMQSVQQTPAGRGVAARQQMSALKQSQERVNFYYDRGIVVEQMWLA